MLTNAQLLTLKNDILADPVLSTFPPHEDGAFAILALYNVTATPDFWVWRTQVPKDEIVGVTTAEGTVWSWTIFINRSQGERDGWRAMINGAESLNFSLANVRQGLQDIFSGAGGAAQRTHLFTIGRRKATRIEKLFATGTGSTASPALMQFEGSLTVQEIQTARQLP